MPADQPRFGKNAIDDLQRRVIALEKALLRQSNKRPHLPLMDFSAQGTPFAQDGAVLVDYRGTPLDTDRHRNPRYSYGGQWHLLDSAEFEIKIVSDSSTVFTGDAQQYMLITHQLHNLDLVEVAGYVSGQSTSGAITAQIRNIITGFDLLSTPLTINANQYTSYAVGTTPAVVDPAHKTVSKGDLLRFDVDTAGANARGLGITVRFN
jgi:hypothetical protein